MDILIFIFLLSFLYKIRIKGNQKDYLSKDYTIYLKGILALIVVFCHLQFNRVNFVGFKIFNYVGDFAVALFFFLSGYGLISQYLKKGDLYLQDFLKKRVLKIIIIYIFFIFIYSIYYYLNGTFMSFSFIVTYFLDKKLIVSHSWYIIDILLLYLLFYIFAKRYKTDYKKISLNILIFSILIGVTLILLGFEECWYVSILSFYFGFIYKLYFDKEIKFKKIIFIVLGFLLLEFLVLILDYINISMIRTFLTAIIKNLACICFIIITINIGRIIQFRNPLFKFLGGLSLEIYLIHGLYENIFREISYISNNNFLYGIIILFLSIFSSVLIRKIFVYKSYRKEVN